MSNTITITERLIRATSLDQLRNEHGKARMNMPYWVALDSSPLRQAQGGSESPDLLFQFVGMHTDPEVLQQQINHGLVWIQEKYVLQNEK